MASIFSSISVYCGSNSGVNPAFKDAAASLGKILSTRHIRLIYGGEHIGLMGVLADATLANGGEIFGVITDALKRKEVAHESLTALIVVETASERRAMMADLADAFIMLPGGFGTLGEFLEVLAWTQVGMHLKPCGILNVGDYFNPLLAMIENAAEQSFIQADYADMIFTASDPLVLIDRLESWEPLTIDKPDGPNDQRIQAHHDQAE